MKILFDQLKYYNARLDITITPPKIINKFGVSAVPIHTQKGPNAVSNNINKPILEAGVYLVAKVKQAKDIGSIINPEKEIDKYHPCKSKFG